MATLSLRTLVETPPGGHRFFCEPTKRWIPVDAPAHNYHDLRDAVVSHYKANNLQPPPDLDRVIQDQECSRLPAGWCKDEYGNFNFDGTDCSSLQALVQGTATLAEWKLKGSVIVEDTEVMRRSQICAKCPFNGVVANCSVCGMKAVKDIVDKIVGGNALATDTSLQHCTICCCSLQAKVRIPLDILRHHTPEKQMARLPDHCWIKEPQQ